MIDEFSLIEKIRRKIESLNLSHPVLKVPPGDDAALLAGLTHPVISTDCHRDKVHFRLDWQKPEEIGFKAAVVTLSDLAASCARPVCLFVNLSVPSDATETLILRLYDGIIEALALYPCALGGGNVSSGSDLALDLFAIGEGDPTLFPLRSEAQAGEGLYVTGSLGLARAGLHALSGNHPAPSALIQAFIRPKARFDAAEVLARHRIRCLMDISDGLAGDALHLADASNIAIHFHIDPIRVPSPLREYCLNQGLSPVDMMLGGGEDYELLFACDEALFETIHKHLPESFRVGTCLAYKGIRILNPPLTTRSFVHRPG